MSETTLYEDAKLIDAVRVIEGTAKRMAVVLASNNKVLGTLTDGDIRRCLLQGLTLQTSVIKAMNANPVTAPVNSSDSAILECLKKHNIRSLPLVDSQQKFVRSFHERELITDSNYPSKDKTFAAAIIMAGGEGTRLRPLTENLPKPMVEINGLPLLERQVRRLANMGISKIYISVNYLGDIIKDHFGNGQKFDVEINYLQEDKKLGTAGALSLLPDMKDLDPVIVMNGDVLTNSDFNHLYHFHMDHNSAITVSAIDYHVEIPYGVIQNDGANIKSLEEKPSQRFLCNAGIYALSIEVLSKVPNNLFWNMTDLIEKCLADGDRVTVFPIHEYWSDIGTHDDLKKVREEITKV